MSRPSQRCEACGNRDASLSFAGALDRPADDGHANDFPAGFSGSDSRPNGGFDDGPDHGTDHCNTAGRDRTTSTDTPLGGTGHTRNGDNPDGGARNQAPTAWTSPPLKRDTQIPGEHTPGPPAVGGLPLVAAPPPDFPFFHRTKNADRAHTRDDDGDYRRLQNAVKSPRSRASQSPMTYVSRRCVHWWQTVPSLPRDPRQPDDVDSRSVDHAADATRMAIVSDGQHVGSSQEVHV